MALLNHGQWKSWLLEEFSWTDRTAQRFMSVTNRFKSDTVSDLAIDPSALYLLASKKTPEPLVEGFLEMAKAGKVVTQQMVKSAIAEHFNAHPEPSRPIRKASVDKDIQRIEKVIQQLSLNWQTPEDRQAAKQAILQMANEF
jgi:hypothetical protein